MAVCPFDPDHTSHERFQGLELHGGRAGIHSMVLTFLPRLLSGPGAVLWSLIVSKWEG